LSQIGAYKYCNCRYDSCTYAKTGHKFGKNGVYNYSKSDTAVLNASNFNIGTQNVL